MAGDGRRPRSSRLLGFLESHVDQPTSIPGRIAGGISYFDEPVGEFGKLVRLHSAERGTRPRCNCLPFEPGREVPDDSPGAHAAPGPLSVPASMLSMYSSMGPTGMRRALPTLKLRSCPVLMSKYTVGRLRWRRVHASATVISAACGFVVVMFDVLDRKSTRLNSSHANISYAVF